MKVYNFTVVIEQDEDGNFLATCPSLEGCQADGATMEEALATIQTMIKMHIAEGIESEESFAEEMEGTAEMKESLGEVLNMIKDLIQMQTGVDEESAEVANEEIFSTHLNKHIDINYN